MRKEGAVADKTGDWKRRECKNECGDESWSYQESGGSGGILRHAERRKGRCWLGDLLGRLKANPLGKHLRAAHVMPTQGMELTLARNPNLTFSTGGRSSIGRQRNSAEAMHIAVVFAEQTLAASHSHSLSKSSRSILQRGASLCICCPCTVARSRVRRQGCEGDRGERPAAATALLLS
jgi:hypothetical protein